MNIDNKSEYNDEIYPSEYNPQRELTPRDIIQHSVKSSKSNNSKITDVLLNPNGFDVPIPLLSRIISETDVPLTSSTSCVHFLLLGLCQAFDLTPEDASIYISRNIDQLFDYIINGYNNNFQPVYKLFQIYLKYASKLGLILVDESHLIQNVLNFLSKSFYSQDERIIELGVDLINSIAKYAESQSNYSQLYEWLCVAYDNNNNNNPMIFRLIELYKTKHSIKNSIIRFLSSYCLPYVADIVLDITPNYLDTMIDYIPFLHGILDIINIDVFSFDDLNQIYELCISIRSTVDYQLLSFTLPYVYMEIIRLLNGNDEDSIGLIDNCIAELKRLIRTPNPDLQIISLSCMFYLLDTFTKNNHCFAPSLYKTIIFTFLETRKQQFIHHFIISNLIELLADSLSSVPIGILVEPLMKQNTHYEMDNYDLQLLYTLSSHPMLTAYHSGLILEPLKPLLFRDKIQSPICSLIYMIIILRFNDNNIMNIVQDTVQNAIEMILNIIKNNRLNSSNTIPFNLCVDYLATLLLSNNALIIEITANEIIPLQPLPIDLIDDIRKAIENLFELIPFDTSSPPESNDMYEDNNNNNNNIEEYNKLFAAPSLFEQEQQQQQQQQFEQQQEQYEEEEELQQQEQQEELMKQYAKEQLKDIQVENPEDVVIYPEEDEHEVIIEKPRSKSFCKTPIPSKSRKEDEEEKLKQMLIEQEEQEQQQQLEQQKQPLPPSLPNEEEEEEEEDEEEIQQLQPPPSHHSYFPQERSKPPSQVKPAFITPLPPPSSHQNRSYNDPINEPLFSQPIDFLTTPDNNDIESKPSIFPSDGNDIYIPPLRPPTMEQQQQQQRKSVLDKQTNAKPKSKIPLKKKSRFPPIKPNQQEQYNENEEPIKFRSAKNKNLPPLVSSKPTIPQLPSEDNNKEKKNKYFTPPIPELKENDNTPQAERENEAEEEGGNDIVNKLKTQKKMIKTKTKTKKTVEDNEETKKWKKQRQEAVDLARQTLKRAEDFKTQQQQTKAKTKGKRESRFEEERDKEIPPTPTLPEIKIDGKSSEEIEKAKELLMPYKKSFYKLYIFFCKLKTSALGRDPIFSDLDKKTNTLNFAGWLAFLLKFDLIDYISKSDAKILFNKLIAKRKLHGLGFEEFIFCISSIATSDKWIGNSLQERVFHMLFHMQVNVVVCQKGKAEKIRLNQWVNDTATYLKTIGYDVINEILKENPDAILLYGLKRDINEESQTIQVDEDSFDNVISLSDNYILFSKEKEKDDGELMNAIKTQTKNMNWNTYDDFTLLISDMNIGAKSPLGKLYKKLEDYMKDEYKRLFKRRAATIETSMENEELENEKKEVKEKKMPTKIPIAVKKPKPKVIEKEKEKISPPKTLIQAKKSSPKKPINEEDNRLAAEDAKLLKKAGINDPLSDRANAILTMFKENKNKPIKEEINLDSDSENEESYILNLPEDPIESSVQHYSPISPPTKTSPSPPPKSIKSFNNSPKKTTENSPSPSHSISPSPFQQQQQQQQQEEEQQQEEQNHNELPKFDNNNPIYDNLISPPDRKSKVFPPNPPPDIDLQSIDSTTTATMSVNEKPMSVLSQREDPPNRPPEKDSFFVPSEYDDNDSINNSLNYISPVNQQSHLESNPKVESPKKEEIKPKPVVQPPKTPANEDNKPKEEIKPKEEETKPKEDQSKPKDEIKPQEEEIKPQEEETKPKEEEIKPKDEIKPQEEEIKPKEEEPKPKEEASKPKEEENKDEPNKPAPPKIPGKIPGNAGPKHGLNFGKGKKGPAMIKPPH